MRINTFQKYVLYLLFYQLIYSPCQSVAQIISLQEVVTKTLNNYPLLQQRKAEMAAGKAHENTIFGNRLPSLLLQDQLDMGTVNSSSGSYFPLSVVPSISGGNNTESKNTLNQGNIAIAYLQWEFLNFGYYHAQQKEARAQTEFFEANYEADKYFVLQNIIFYYLDWLKKYLLLQIKTEDVNRAQVILTSIRANVVSGLKPGVDSSTARAVFSGTKISYLQAINDFNNDKIVLSTWSGINLDNIVPDSNIISSSMIQRLSSPTITESVSLIHPLLNIFQKQYELQLANNISVSKKYLPRLSINGAYWERSTGISPTGVFTDNFSTGMGLAMPYSRYNYLLGLTATYNLFDLKHRSDFLAEGKLQAQAKAEAVKTQALNLNSLLLQTNAAYQSILQQLVEIPIQQYSAQQAYQQQLALYKSGLNTLIEVTNAQYTLVQSETNFVVNQTELLRLLYIKAALSGQQDDFLKNFK